MPHYLYLLYLVTTISAQSSPYINYFNEMINNRFKRSLEHPPDTPSTYESVDGNFYVRVFASCGENCCDKKMKRFCGGVLISEDQVLVPATCLLGYTCFKVCFGSDLCGEREPCTTSTTAYMHANFLDNVISRNCMEENFGIIKITPFKGVTPIAIAQFAEEKCQRFAIDRPLHSIGCGFEDDGNKAQRLIHLKGEESSLGRQQYKNKCRQLKTMFMKSVGDSEFHSEDGVPLFLKGDELKDYYETELRKDWTPNATDYYLVGIQSYYKEPEKDRNSIAFVCLNAYEKMLASSYVEQNWLPISLANERLIDKDQAALDTIDKMYDQYGVSIVPRSIHCLVRCVLGVKASFLHQVGQQLNNFDPKTIEMDCGHVFSMEECRKSRNNDITVVRVEEEDQQVSRPGNIYGSTPGDPVGDDKTPDAIPQFSTDEGFIEIEAHSGKIITLKILSKTCQSILTEAFDDYVIIKVGEGKIFVKSEKVPTKKEIDKVQGTQTPSVKTPGSDSSNQNGDNDKDKQDSPSPQPLLGGSDVLDDYSNRQKQDGDDHQNDEGLPVAPVAPRDSPSVSNPTDIEPSIEPAPSNPGETGPVEIEETAMPNSSPDGDTVSPSDDSKPIPPDDPKKSDDHLPPPESLTMPDESHLIIIDLENPNPLTKSDDPGVNPSNPENPDEKPPSKIEEIIKTEPLHDHPKKPSKPGLKNPECMSGPKNTECEEEKRKLDDALIKVNLENKPDKDDTWTNNSGSSSVIVIDTSQTDSGSGETMGNHNPDSNNHDNFSHDETKVTYGAVNPRSKQHRHNKPLISIAGRPLI